MAIIIFKYPNRGIHTGRMRNVSGRKMKLLPAANCAGPVPSLGDTCSKLFTPWQTALHIYYGAVVQLRPRIMEVGTTFSSPSSVLLSLPRQPAKSVARNTSREWNRKQQQKQQACKWSSMVSMVAQWDVFCCWYFPRFAFRLLCVQWRKEKCHRGERKAQTFSPKQNLFSPCCSLTHSAVLALVRSAFPPFPTLSVSLALSLSLANALHNSWHANFSIEHKRNKAKRPQCLTTRRVRCPGNGRKSVEAVATLPPFPAAPPPYSAHHTHTVQSTETLFNIFACLRLPFFSCYIPCNLKIL